MTLPITARRRCSTLAALVTLLLLVAGCGSARDLLRPPRPVPAGVARSASDTITWPYAAQWPMWGRSPGHGFQQDLTSMPGPLAVRWQTVLPYRTFTEPAPNPNFIPYSPVIDAAGNLYVTTADCRIHCLESVGGAIEWSSDPLPGEWLAAAPAYIERANDGLLYVLSSTASGPFAGGTGYLRIYSVSPAAPPVELWEYQLGVNPTLGNCFVEVTTQHPILSPDGDFFFAYERTDMAAPLWRSVTWISPFNGVNAPAVDELYTGVAEEENIIQFSGEDIVDIVLNYETWAGEVEGVSRQLYLVTSCFSSNTPIKSDRLLMRIGLDNPAADYAVCHPDWRDPPEQQPSYPLSLLLTRSNKLYESSGSVQLYNPLTLFTDINFIIGDANINWTVDLQNEDGLLGLYAALDISNRLASSNEFELAGGGLNNGLSALEIKYSTERFHWAAPAEGLQMAHGSIASTRKWDDNSDPLRTYVVFDDRFYFDIPDQDNDNSPLESEGEDPYFPGHIWPPLRTDAHATVTLGRTPQGLTQLYAVGENCGRLQTQYNLSEGQDDNDGPSGGTGGNVGGPGGVGGSGGGGSNPTAPPPPPLPPVGWIPPGVQEHAGRVVAIRPYLDDADQDDTPDLHTVEGKVAYGPQGARHINEDTKELEYDLGIKDFHSYNNRPLYYTGQTAKGQFIHATPILTGATPADRGEFTLELEAGQYVVYQDDYPREGPPLWSYLDNNYQHFVVTDNGVTLATMYLWHDAGEDPGTFEVKGKVITPHWHYVWDEELQEWVQEYWETPIPNFPIYCSGFPYGGEAYDPPLLDLTSAVDPDKGWYSFDLPPGRYMLYNPSYPLIGPPLWASLINNYQLIEVVDADHTATSMLYFGAVGG